MRGVSAGRLASSFARPASAYLEPLHLYRPPSLSLPVRALLEREPHPPSLTQTRHSHKHYTYRYVRKVGYSLLPRRTHSDFFLSPKMYVALRRDAGCTCGKQLRREGEGYPYTDEAYISFVDICRSSYSPRAGKLSSLRLNTRKRKRRSLCAPRRREVEHGHMQRKRREKKTQREREIGGDRENKRRMTTWVAALTYDREALDMAETFQCLYKRYRQECFLLDRVRGRRGQGGYFSSFLGRTLHRTLHTQTTPHTDMREPSGPPKQLRPREKSATERDRHRGAAM